MSRPRMDGGRWTLLGLVVAMLVSLVWLVDPWFDSMWDAVLYVLTTRSLLEGEGYTVYGDPFHLRPPGFSILLMPVMGLFGENYLAWNVYVSLYGILAVALAFLYFKPRLGVPVTAAFCASIWLNPQFQSICTTILSDGAGIAAVFACLLLDRWARRGEGLGREVVLGLTLAFTGYLRTVTTLLLPALALARLLDRDTVHAGQSWAKKGLRLGIVFAIPLLSQVPWSMWKEANPPPMPSRQHGIYSYWTAQWHVDASNPDSPRRPLGEILDRVPRRSRECFTSLGSRLPKVTLLGMPGPEEIQRIREENKRPLGLPLGIFGVACLVGVGLVRRDAGSIFCAGTLGVCLIYFDFDDRLLIPNYFFVLGATLEVLLGLRRWLPEKGVVLGVTGLVALMGISDAFPPNERDFVEERTRIHGEVARWVETHYPPEVNVAASLGHEIAVDFQRPLYFLEVAAMRGGPQGLRAVIQERRVRVLVDTGDENGWLRRFLDPFLARGWRQVHEHEGVRVYELEVPAGGRQPRRAPGGR